MEQGIQCPKSDSIQALPRFPPSSPKSSPLIVPISGKYFLPLLGSGYQVWCWKDAVDPPVSATLKLVFPFLWAVNQDAISAVPTSVNVSRKIELKNIELHKVFIIQPKHITPVNTTHIDLTSTPPVLEQMNAKLTQLVSNQIMADSSKPINHKRRFETRLNSIFQTLILAASKRSDNEEDAYLTTTS